MTNETHIDQYTYEFINLETQFSKSSTRFTDSNSENYEMNVTHYQNTLF